MTGGASAVVNHGHEGIFIRSVQGVLPRLDRQRFEIVVAVTRPALNRARAALGDDGLTWLALSPRWTRPPGSCAARLDLLYHWEVGSDSFNYFLPWFRPAPLQYTSWAWPLTTGIPGMDFFLSSDLAEPEGAQDLYRETLLTMPGNMFTWAEPPTPPERPMTRADFGLADGEHLYLCAQNPRKIHPDFDPLAAGILERDPRARVLLIGSREGAETAPCASACNGAWAPWRSASPCCRARAGSAIWACWTWWTWPWTRPITAAPIPASTPWAWPCR